MERLKLELRTMDVGAPFDGPHALADAVREQTLQAWDAGADLVVFPEFSWMALERFVGKQQALDEISGLFQGELLPVLQQHLSRPDKAVVLGSVPWREPGGLLRNRVMIGADGRWWHQDKIHLTPWEADFTGGGPLRIWEFAGWRIAVVVCLDIEIPEISAALRGRDVDLLLVPSATDNVLGVERIQRCASARAVELGCYVGVCPLLGRMPSEWVDENIGRIAVHAPSQSSFAGMMREDSGPLLSDGFHGYRFELSQSCLLESRSRREETHPALVKVAGITIEAIDE